MKLKDKLANEYQTSRLENYISVMTNQEAFLAGFEKCREMAKEKLNAFPDYLDSYQNDHLDELGNEEVE